MGKMRAVVFHEHGGLEKLKHTYVKIPKTGKREVLVKVHACALNHLDLWTLAGMRGVSIPLPHILGSDIAGEVVEKGAKVRGVPMGKTVVVSPGIRSKNKNDPYRKAGWDSLSDDYKILGLQVDGGYAEYIKVPAENVIPVSGNRDPIEWAAAPLVFLTAWHMLITRAELKKGETVLIHGAGSGVGSAAIQLARHLGAHVITTVGRDEKVRLAKKIGAHDVIQYQKKDFLVESRRITKNKGVDVVLEHIGPATFQKSLACLKRKGRLVTCGVTSGPMVSFDLRYVFARQLSIMGCYMGGLEELKKVISLIEKKKLSPTLDETFSLREAPKALRRMKSRAHFGKIVLTL